MIRWNAVGTALTLFALGLLAGVTITSNLLTAALR